MESNLYHYKARVTDVHDGDTCTVDIDLGFSIWMNGEKLRLNRINAPELTGSSKKAGMASRDFLRKIIMGKELTLETIRDKKEKYGRYLAELWVLDKSGKRININDLLVEKGFAEYKKY